jgi:hypothetical protein
MLIDCDTCRVRGPGCDGCLVSVLIEPPAEVLLLDRDELWAIETLARAGFEVALVEPRPPEGQLVPLISRQGRAA